MNSDFHMLQKIFSGIMFSISYGIQVSTKFVENNIQVAFGFLSADEFTLKRFVEVDFSLKDNPTDLIKLPFSLMINRLFKSNAS